MASAIFNEIFRIYSTLLTSLWWVAKEFTFQNICGLIVHFKCTYFLIIFRLGITKSSLTTAHSQSSLRVVISVPTILCVNSSLAVSGTRRLGMAPSNSTPPISTRWLLVFSIKKTPWDDIKIVQKQFNHCPLLVATERDLPAQISRCVGHSVQNAGRTSKGTPYGNLFGKLLIDFIKKWTYYHFIYYNYLNYKTMIYNNNTDNTMLYKQTL